jgi:hypothetical protein
MESLKQCQENRRPAGHPLGTLSCEPAKNRGKSAEAAERVLESQREYKRMLRAGELKPAKKRGRGSSAIKRVKRGVKGSGT